MSFLKPIHWYHSLQIQSGWPVPLTPLTEALGEVGLFVEKDLG
jgi:hypothetical protein